MGDLEQKAHDLAVAVAIEQQRVINDCKLKAGQLWRLKRLFF